MMSLSNTGVKLSMCLKLYCLPLRIVVEESVTVATFPTAKTSLADDVGCTIKEVTEGIVSFPEITYHGKIFLHDRKQVC